MQDHHVRLELACRLGVILTVDGHHALAEGGSAKGDPPIDGAHGERRALPLAHLLHALPLALDAADLRACPRPHPPAEQAEEHEEEKAEEEEEEEEEGGGG